MSLDKITWRNELSINNHGIDKDHENLIEIYNELVDLTQNNLGRQEFARILSKMTDYTLTHFKREEIYMQEFAYPQLTQHKEFHSYYNYKVAMYNVNLLGPNPPEPKEILTFLKKWWENHILVHDANYEQYKQEIESSVNYNNIIT